MTEQATTVTQCPKFGWCVMGHAHKGQCSSAHYTLTEVVEPKVEAGDRALETRKIEVLRCKSCGRLSISVDSVRQDTKSHAGDGHGDGKCSGQWTVLVSAESAMNAQERELVNALREAKVRLGICLGRMRACEADHEVSLEEIPAWIEDTERLLAERGEGR